MYLGIFGVIFIWDNSLIISNFHFFSESLDLISLVPLAILKPLVLPNADCNIHSFCFKVTFKMLTLKTVTIH